VRNLGLVTPWLCQASLTHRERLQENELAQLEGETAVPFVDGVAEFTRLRVDRKADKLFLSFTTVPSRFQTETSVEFRVVGFPQSVERKQVSFLLSGSGIPSSVEWNGAEVIGEVVRGVSMELDMDPSRIQNVTMQEIEWDGERVVYVELTLLGPHSSDPPNVPSLPEAGLTLQSLVDSGSLSITVGGVPLTAVTESFDITPAPPPTVSTAAGGGAIDDNLVLILLTGGAGVAVGFSLVIVGVACCVWCRQKTRDKKGRVERLSGQSSFSQLPRLRPVVKVNPLADDEGSSSDDNIEVVPSFRPSSHFPVTPSPHLPSSPYLWDYDPDDADSDTSGSVYDRSQANLDCWMSPLYATPSSRLPGTRAGSKFSHHQPTTLSVLANQPLTHHQRSSAPPTHLPPPSHLTFVQPAPQTQPRGRGFQT
jgi:hypothetical protein